MNSFAPEIDVAEADALSMEANSQGEKQGINHNVHGPATTPRAGIRAGKFPPASTSTICERDSTPIPEYENDAGRSATEEELNTCRRIRGRIPGRVWLVALIAAAQRFTYWSTQVTWQNLMQYGPEDNIQGIAGLGQARAVTVNNAFNVVIFILPLFVGPIADGYLGRYKTLQICNGFYLVGMGLMLGFSTPPAIDSGVATPGFFVSLFLVGIGLGGVQCVTNPLIADQYDEKSFKIAYRKKTGEKVVIDRDLTIHYIYAIYFWLANLASLGMIPASLLEQSIGFWSAYTMTTGVLAISCVVLWLGKPKFILAAPSDTIMPQIFRVLMIAIKSGFKLDAALPQAQLEKTGHTTPWNDEFIAGIRSALRVIKVCLIWPFLRLSIGVISANSIAQAGQMETGGIPNNLLMALNAIALVIIGVFVENMLYPWLEKSRINFGDIARIETGLIFMVLSVAYCTVVQALIYRAPPCYNFAGQCTNPSTGATITGPNRISVGIQTPIYLLVAVSEVFALVTGQAYAYKKAPVEMKSMLQSMYAVFNGIGYLLAMAIGPTAQNPDLVVMWASVTAVMGAATILFWICFRDYDSSERKEADQRL